MVRFVGRSVLFSMPVANVLFESLGENSFVVTYVRSRKALIWSSSSTGSTTTLAISLPTSSRTSGMTSMLCVPYA